MHSDGGDCLVIWEFKIKPELRAEFEKVYGCEGEWAQLFRQSRDFQGTRLFKDANAPDRYLTFDFWRSKPALQEFKKVHDAEYRALDKRCEALTLEELLVGEFLG